MRFLIISHAVHSKSKQKLYAYAPYVREMNLWLKFVDTVEIVAPFTASMPTKIDLEYEHTNLTLNKIPEIAFTSITHILHAFCVLPYIVFKLFVACAKADHIHLRCPGNIGLLGCLVQVFFPKKTKTAKYAGNWDPNAKQPKSYRFQKWLLSNTTWTKNMSVLVYGNWGNQTKNIKSFFTATFKDSEKTLFKAKSYSNQINFIFVGSLVEGKRPLFAIQLVEALQKNGYHSNLDVFGDGILKEDLQSYIASNKIENIILHGNQTKTTLKSYLKKSHFTILASKSEGWPKALAEAMFYGVIPISTKISCVPYMLDFGKRGLLIEPELYKATQLVLEELKDQRNLIKKAELALNWSQNYTLDAFETEIKALII